MSSQDSQAVGEEPRSQRSGIVKIAIVVAAVIAILLLRQVIGLGAAFAHYSTAPDFDSVVAEYVVQPEKIDEWLPDGKLLTENEAWTLGESDPENWDKLGASIEVHITHGSQVLLETTVNLEALVDPETWARKGFLIPVPEIRTRDGMHAVVQVGLYGLPRFLDGGWSSGQAVDYPGQVFVDAVLAAGEGPDLFRVVELDSLPPSFEAFDLHSPMLRGLLGLFHPPGGVPEEGILHQARGNVYLSWRKYPSGGSGGPGLGASEARTNCLGYSNETRVTTSARKGDSGRGSKTTKTWSVNYTWNGKTW